MNNSNYNSLTEKLMQSGLIKSEESDKNKDNFFEVALEEKNVTSNHNIEIPEALQKKTKRLNKSDFEMVSQNSNNSINLTPMRLIQRFINIKQSQASKGSLNFAENFLFAFFPRLYKAKLARNAMKKLKELNIDTSKLLDKNIPYGEGEIRYQNLIKYISYANEIQTQIRKETN